MYLRSGSFRYSETWMLSQSFTAASRRRFDTSPVYGVTYLRSITSTSSAFREESAFDYRILPFQIDHCPGEQLNCGCHFAAKRSTRRLALFRSVYQRLRYLQGFAVWVLRRPCCLCFLWLAGRRHSCGQFLSHSSHSNGVFSGDLISARKV